MTAEPLPTGNDPPRRGPCRSRGDLVPLTTSDGWDHQSGTWFLGSTGLTAHLPAPDTAARGSLRLVARHGDVLHERSLCGVFLSQVPAGSAITQCPVCRDSNARPQTGCH